MSDSNFMAVALTVPEKHLKYQNLTKSCKVSEQ